MKFKILSLILSSALALAACNNEAKDIEKSPKDESKTEQQSETTDTKATDTNDKNDNADEKNDAKQEGENSVEEQDDVDNQDEATEADDDNDNNDASIKLDDIKVSPEDAIKTAQKKIPGELESISFDNDNSQWIYAISLIDTNKKTHEIKVDAEQNKVISTQVEDDTDNVMTFDYGKFIPADEIIKAAQKVYNGEIKEWSLDHDDGKFKYNVELKGQDGKSKEFELDAKDMKILSKGV